MKLLVADQRTDAWRLARAGRLTSSRAADMLAQIKRGEAKSRRQLRTQLVLERLTGTPQEPGFVSADMQYGLRREPEALAAYEAESGLVVRRVGFCAHDTLAAGCSPDGIVDDFDGLLELKCCTPATHLDFLETGTIPRAHLLQLTHQLWITGARWADYVSFDDRFPSGLQLAIGRVTAGQFDLTLYERNVCAFLDEVDAKCRQVRSWAEESEVA
jgi:predicted phage-related endonuclease